MTCTWKFLERIALALAVLAAVMAWSLACGDDGAGEAEPAVSFPAGGGGAAAGEVKKIAISLLDNKFDPVELTVDGGVILQLDIANRGAAIHNLRIAGPDNKYANEDDAVSDPPLVRAGETAALAWLAPVSGGTFDFRCDFHPQAMTGKIRVTPGEETTNGGQEGP